MKPDAPFDLQRTYVFLEDGGRAPAIEVSEAFWHELMSGRPTSPDAALVANGAGWLTAVYAMDRDTPSWEMHPAGDELLVLLSGAIDVVLDGRDGQRVVALTAGASCVVPRGTWHRQIVRTPALELAVTYGKGTEHRPVEEATPPRRGT
jgi:mannose-6-phosphate isomerase-like protein (cupin superfamily)